MEKMTWVLKVLGISYYNCLPCIKMNCEECEYDDKKVASCMRSWGVTEFQHEYCSVDSLMTKIEPRTPHIDW